MRASGSALRLLRSAVDNTVAAVGSNTSESKASHNNQPVSQNVLIFTTASHTSLAVFLLQILIEDRIGQRARDHLFRQCLVHLPLMELIRHTAR